MKVGETLSIVTRAADNVCADEHIEDIREATADDVIAWLLETGREGEAWETMRALGRLAGPWHEVGDGEQERHNPFGDAWVNVCQSGGAWGWWEVFATTDDASDSYSYATAAEAKQAADDALRAAGWRLVG
jgi:hypothetical protein